MHFPKWQGIILLNTLLQKGDGTMPKNDNEKTLTFSIRDEKDRELRMILSTVYEALSEKGYNPINQIVGYILSDDPTYITSYNGARGLIAKLERDELLEEFVKTYVNNL